LIMLLPFIEQQAMWDRIVNNTIADDGTPLPPGEDYPFPEIRHQRSIKVFGCLPMYVLRMGRQYRLTS